MLVILDWKRFETALVQVPPAGRASVSMPPLRMCQRHPAGEVRQITVVNGPQHEVPMVRHEAVGYDPHLRSLLSINNDALECLVILIFLENGHPRVSAVPDMINESPFGGTFRSSNARQSTDSRAECQ